MESTLASESRIGVCEPRCWGLRDTETVTLVPTKVYIVKAMVFPVVMYGVRVGP